MFGYSSMSEDDLHLLAGRALRGCEASQTEFGLWSWRTSVAYVDCYVDLPLVRTYPVSVDARRAHLAELIQERFFIGVEAAHRNRVNFGSLLAGTALTLLNAYSHDSSGDASSLPASMVEDLQGPWRRFPQPQVSDARLVALHDAQRTSVHDLAGLLRTSEDEVNRRLIAGRRALIQLADPWSSERQDRHA